MLRASGDPVSMLLPDDTPADIVELYRARWGLDEPVAVQYFRYIVSVMQGEFGISFRDGRPALETVVERIPATLLLGGAAFLMSILIGIPAGICAALNRNTYIDRALMALAMLGHSQPSFFLGILLILLFSVTLGVLPSSGGAAHAHLVLPAFTLGVWHAATLARFTRSAMLDVLGQQYIRAARAYGVPLVQRVFRHALPNAAIPIVTILGLMLGHLFAGAILIESVFGWPGLGRLTVTAVASRDLSVVQAIVMLTTLAMVAANLTVDISYSVIDPRVRLGRTRVEG
jgi:peptide/nickel transport system permease protein